KNFEKSLDTGPGVKYNIFAIPWEEVGSYHFVGWQNGEFPQTSVLARLVRQRFAKVSVRQYSAEAKWLE
ncbi:MAG: hypothetical protein K6F08_02690, partial [bacterium]|nr:hypothetical protein [bacterium]